MADKKIEDFDDDDFHEEHVDESWLVSYADLMTLLFGLFVLLYSMNQLPKDQADKIRESTREKFGPQTKKMPKEDKKINPKELQAKIKELKAAQVIAKSEKQKLIDENENLKTQVESKLALEANNETLKINQKKEMELKEQEISKLKKELELAQSLVSKDINEKELIDELRKKIEKVSKNEKRLQVDLKEKTEFLNKKNEEQELSQALKKQLAMLKSELTSAKNQLSSVNQKKKTGETQLRKISSLQRQVSELKMGNNLLERAIKKQTGDAASQSFLAVFINWSTVNHDIDLVIKDPTGKKFNFKKKKYDNHPGYFALDTRRGPGAELWQSDRIIPGTYTATYSFYNQYGNESPAKVLGTIYSPKGSVVLKPVEMTIGGKRKFTVKFRVDENGAVKIINSN